MATEPRYVARAEAGVGWRVWDRRLKRWWGNFFSEHPGEILQELNGQARPKALAALARPSKSRLQARVLAAHGNTFRKLSG